MVNFDESDKMIKISGKLSIFNILAFVEGNRLNNDLSSISKRQKNSKN